MKESKTIFRHELKYRISSYQKRIISSKLECFLQKDTHVENGLYSIRSLYFDDINNSAYNEKIMGISTRKKYRIRFYGYSDNCIKLECKIKQGSYIYKESAKLTKENVESILEMDFDFLRDREEDVCKRFYYECITNQMRPRVIVDYEREPFVFEYGDVRITFDNEIREVELVGDLFDSDLPAYNVMGEAELIMEVKYTSFIPEFIKNILAGIEGEYIAASKYVMCCDKKIERIGLLV